MTSSTPTISIIIPTWNGLRILPQCLDALRAQTRLPDEILVVDNASTDGTAKHLQTHYPEVTRVALDDNLGTAGGMNAGFRASRGDYIVLLNNDVFLSPDWIEVMLNALENQTEFAFAACRIRMVKEPGKIDSAGDGFDPVQGAVMIGHGQADGPEFDQPREVFSATGAASMYRREVFEHTGGFDESLFIYVEDVDLGFRARLQGFRCLYVPGATANHVGGATSGRLSPFQVRLMYRNGITIYLKNMPWPLLRTNLLRWLRWWVGMLHHAAHHRAALQGILAALQRLPATIKSRQQVQSQITITPEKLLTAMTPTGTPIKLRGIK